MKIICAFDSFKECMSAAEASETAARAARIVFPEADVTVIPGADGGEGTAEIMASRKGGVRIDAFAHDALFRPVTAAYYYVSGIGDAFIDLASASGLSLISSGSRDPMTATSYGTGELILHALRQGARRVTLCFGGSATNDGGAGLLQALGVSFLRSDGSVIADPMCPALFEDVADVSVSSLEPLCRDKMYAGLYDTTARFCGLQGASIVFSRQKGAYGDIPSLLDFLLSELREKFRASGLSCPLFPGSGAAGGAGGVWEWIMGADMIPGGEAVLDAAGFDSLVTPDTVILTGEGRSDSQTLTGKFPQRVLSRGLRAGAEVVLFSGSSEDRDELLAAGFTDVKNITPPSMPLEEALRREVAERNLTETVISYLSGLRFSLI